MPTSILMDLQKGVACYLCTGEHIKHLNLEINLKPISKQNNITNGNKYNQIDYFLCKQGFETRGTEIGNRQITWDNLIRILEKGTELIDDVTRIPGNIIPLRYQDMHSLTNNLLKSVSNFVLLEFRPTGKCFGLINVNFTIFH